MLDTGATTVSSYQFVRGYRRAGERGAAGGIRTRDHRLSRVDPGVPLLIPYEAGALPAELRRLNSSKTTLNHFKDK